MKISYLIVGFLTFALSACRTGEDAWLAKARTAVPPINGGFHFKQYVVLKPSGNEVLGDEGVLFISSTMLTNEELKTIAESPSGKNAHYGDEAATYFHLINTCLSATSRSSGDAAVAAGYLSLVLTRASAEKNSTGIRFRLYSWPDFWYDWHIKQTGDSFIVDDSSTRQAFGWESSRIELSRDSSVTMKSCVTFNAKSE